MILLRIHEDDHVSEQKIEWFPCTLGRSMACDVKFKDRSVSGQHAVIEREGDQLILRDLGSTNLLVKNGTAQTMIVLEDRQEVWLGDVKLEVIQNEILPKTVPPAKMHLERKHESFRNMVQWSLVLMGGLLAAAIVVMLEEAKKNWPLTHLWRLFGKSLGLWLAGLLVSVLLALMAKVSTKKLRLFPMATLVFTVGLASFVGMDLMGTIVFNLRMIPGIQALDMTLVLLGSFGALLILMRLLLEQISLRIRLLVAAFFAVGVVGTLSFMGTSGLDDGERTRMAPLGLPILDLTSGIDQDSTQLRGFFFRLIAEVDGERASQLGRDH